MHLELTLSAKDVDTIQSLQLAIRKAYELGFDLDSKVDYSVKLNQYNSTVESFKIEMKKDL